MSKKVKLKLGKLIPLKKERNTWWEKAWAYELDGIRFGTIYKQIYPAAGEHQLIYRFTVNVQIVPSYWAEIPKNGLGYKSNHYKSKTEARKAMKASIITQIKFLNKCLIT